MPRAIVLDVGSENEPRNLAIPNRSRSASYNSFPVEYDNKIADMMFSSHHQMIMRVSSETTCHRRSLCRLSCQRSPLPVSCHEIWNRTCRL